MELRGSQGRFVRRLAVKAGDRLPIQGMLKPGFALLPAGAGVSTSGVSDMRAAIEKVLAASQRVTLFVPDDAALEEAGKSELPPPEWLAFDAGRRPVAGAAAISAARAAPAVGASREGARRAGRGGGDPAVALVARSW